MYHLRDVTHGEIWYERKCAFEVKGGDDDITRLYDRKVPDRMRRADAFKYYNAKIMCVFAELGYVHHSDDTFGIAEYYKNVRREICGL